nr:DUF342 domain-containing protein [Desulfobulbaceae bacterium]
MGSDLVKQGVDICDGQFVVKVSKDKLQAFVSLKDPKSGLTLDDVDVNALMADVRQSGVNFGVLGSPQPREDGTFCVARGVNVVHGENARVKAYVKPCVVRVPKMKESSSIAKVDFRELGSIVNVPKDKLLLEKISPTAGTPGKTVLSEVLSPKAGKDVTVKVGPGVRLSEDGMKAYSEVEGKYMLADGKAAVMTEHLMSGDVDMSTGNIVFVGERITVNGSVQPGFPGKCKKDVDIAMGVQNSASIIAGGEIVIKGGVIGDEIVIQCWGDVKADFVENVGRIEVKGSLHVSDTIIQANVHVGKDVIVTGGKGILIGGKYIVGGSLHAKAIGSEAEVTTEIAVGINPELEERKQHLAKEKQLWPAKMNEIIKNTTALKKQQKDEGGLPPDKMELLKKLNSNLPEVMAKVNELTEKEEALEVELDKATNESVYVYGTVFPGTRVSIGSLSRTLISTEERVVIHLDKATQQIHCRAMTPEEKNNMPV